MDILLIRYASIFRRLRQYRRIFRIEEIQQIFDDTVSYLNHIPFDKRNTDGMHILATISHELAGFNVFRLFDYLILRNHPIFIYMTGTFEMLLTKSTHSQRLKTTEQENDCFNALSYLITQLCLYQNKPIELFYGKISSEIFLVTEKPNPRDENIDKLRKESDELMEKPNRKTARLLPRAPMARPIDQAETDITKISRLKKFPLRYITVLDETFIDIPPPKFSQTELPTKSFEEIFLTKIFFEQFRRAIEDLSSNEYSSYHVKYKVLNRLVRLCSQLNIVDSLVNPIVKCLTSKNYHDVFQTIELNQFQFNPKQLFFIYECPQFLVQHDLLQQETIVNSFCGPVIKTAKSIFDKYFSAINVETDSNEDNNKGLIMNALSRQLELLYHLSFVSSGRQHLFRSFIVQQLPNTLQENEWLISSALVNEQLFYGDVGVVGYSLMLLYNLAHEKQIFTMLKKTELADICLPLHDAKNVTIQFASKTLSKILHEEKIDENNNPVKLKGAYIEFLDNIIIKSKQKTKAGARKYVEEKESDTKYRFITESFLQKLIRDIEYFSAHDEQADKSKYKDVSRRIRVSTKQETNEVESLLDPIIACLNSNYYIKTYEKIEFSDAKVISGPTHNKRNLAAKHFFFMRDCPEFLMRHDYKRQNEIRPPLCRKMLENADTIFKECSPAAMKAKGAKDNDGTKAARIEALMYYIKLLNHFTFITATRTLFSAKPIIDQILSIVENESEKIDAWDHIDNDKIGIVGQCLTLLYNLAFDNRILIILRDRNFVKICDRLSSESDKTIKFAAKSLKVLLDWNFEEDRYELGYLTGILVGYMSRSVKEPRQPYRGVRLNSILKILEKIIENNIVQERIFKEEEGISSLTKCACVKCLDNPSLKVLDKIHRSSLNIIWKLTLTGPAVAKKVKSFDQFVDQLFNLSTYPSEKMRQVAKGIIWKLGDENHLRYEQAEKEKERKQESYRERRNSEDEYRPTTDNQWDDSIPFDLLMSFSNDLNIKNLCHRIHGRLIAKNIRVYMEEQGVHRLELIKKAVDKKKIILVCLSATYRTSKLCMAEIEYAFQNKCPVIPVIVEANYKAKGWLSHLIGGKTPTDSTQKNFNEAIRDLFVEVEKLKASH